MVVLCRQREKGTLTTAFSCVKIFAGGQALTKSSHVFEISSASLGHGNSLLDVDVSWSQSSKMVWKAMSRLASSTCSYLPHKSGTILPSTPEISCPEEPSTHWQFGTAAWASWSLAQLSQETEASSAFNLSACNDISQTYLWLYLPVIQLFLKSHRPVFQCPAPASTRGTCFSNMVSWTLGTCIFGQALDFELSHWVCFDVETCPAMVPRQRAVAKLLNHIHKRSWTMLFWVTMFAKTVL